MNDSATASPRPFLTSVAPQLFVADIKTSCDFFTEKLGFRIDFVYGDPSFYAQVARDNAKFVLRTVDEPVFTNVREREDLLSAAITVATSNEIEQLSLDYQTAGVTFHQPLRQEPWGALTFIVEDPDRNLILFAGPAS